MPCVSWNAPSSFAWHLSCGVLSAAALGPTPPSSLGAVKLMIDSHHPLANLVVWSLARRLATFAPRLSLTRLPTVHRYDDVTSSIAVPTAFNCRHRSLYLIVAFFSAACCHRSLTLLPCGGRAPDKASKNNVARPPPRMCRPRQRHRVSAAPITATTMTKAAAESRCPPSLHPPGVLSGMTEGGGA